MRRDAAGFFLGFFFDGESEQELSNKLAWPRPLSCVFLFYDFSFRGADRVLFMCEDVALCHHQEKQQLKTCR